MGVGAHLPVASRVGGDHGHYPLALASFALGLVIAVGIALMRISGNRVLSGIARVYVSIIRGTRCSCSCS